MLKSHVRKFSEFDSQELEAEKVCFEINVKKTDQRAKSVINFVA